MLHLRDGERVLVEEYPRGMFEDLMLRIDALRDEASELLEMAEVAS